MYGFRRTWGEKAGRGRGRGRDYRVRDGVGWMRGGAEGAVTQTFSGSLYDLSGLSVLFVYGGAGGAVAPGGGASLTGEAL